jgi:hypothetical protein
MKTKAEEFSRLGSGLLVLFDNYTFGFVKKLQIGLERFVRAFGTIYAR